jgi:hypothetical protein
MAFKMTVIVDHPGMKSSGRRYRPPEILPFILSSESGPKIHV